MDYIFLIARILFGGYFAINGFNHLKNPNSLADYAASKKVPSAKAMVILSGLMIFLGGLGVVFGLFVNFSVILIVLFLIPVTFVMHDYWMDTDLNVKMANRANFYKNLALLGAALVFLFIATPWPLAF